MNKHLVFANSAGRLPRKYRIRVRTMLRRRALNVRGSDTGDAEAGSSLEQALHRGSICCKMGGAGGKTDGNAAISEQVDTRAR